MVSAERVTALASASALHTDSKNRLASTNSASPKTFLVWRAQSAADKENVPSFLTTALSRLKNTVGVLQAKVPLVRVLDGIDLAAINGSVVMVNEWNDRWKSLSSVLQRHGGFLQKEKFELFRILSTRLLDALILLSQESEEIALRSLSPDTIILDESGSSLRLLLLPTIFESDHAQNSESVAAYVACSMGHKTRLDCVPNHGRDLVVTAPNWDVWSFGMSLHALAFGDTFSADEVNTNLFLLAFLHYQHFVDRPFKTILPLYFPLPHSSNVTNFSVVRH